jgi:Rrf2 family protein
MIKISTKGRYGTRIMVELGLNHEKGTMLLKDIGQRQNISVRYLEQIIPGLKGAGLINSSRGANGGYTLARSPSEITLKEILYSVEGPLCLVDCIKSPDACERTGLCATREVWGELNEKIDSYLGSHTLEDLLKKHKDKQKSQPLMYSI